MSLSTSSIFFIFDFLISQDLFWKHRTPILIPKIQHTALKKKKQLKKLWIMNFNVYYPPSEIDRLWNPIKAFFSLVLKCSKTTQEILNHKFDVSQALNSPPSEIGRLWNPNNDIFSLVFSPHYFEYLKQSDYSADEDFSP